MEKVFTGFKKIDENLQIKRGELVVIASRPAIGKTSFICSVIKNTAKKQKTLFFAMQLLKSKAAQNLGSLETNSIIVNEVVDIDEVIIKTAESKINNDVSVVFIDNFNDLVACSKYLAKRVILKLKEMAKRLGVAVIVTEQLSRSEYTYSTYLDMVHYDFISLADKILTMRNLDLEYDELELEINCIESKVTLISVDKDLTKYLNQDFRFKFDSNALEFVEI